MRRGRMNLLFALADLSKEQWIIIAATVAVAMLLIIIIIVCARIRIKKNKKKKAEQSSAKTVGSPVCQSPAEPKQVMEYEKKPEERKTSAYVERQAEPAIEPEREEISERAERSNDKPAVQTKPQEGKVYHVSKRKEDGKWQIKLAGGAKAIKLFATQAEALAYCRQLAISQGARIILHKVDGSFRKLNY